MSKRRKIAGSADGALARHQRDHIARQHGGEDFENIRAHARRATRQVRELERHHQANGRNRRRLAHADRMREHEIALQRREIVRIDPDIREPAKPGVDAVNRVAASHDLGDRRGARRNGGKGAVSKFYRRATRDGTPVGERERRAGECNRRHWPFHTRACSGLKPMR